MKELKHGRVYIEKSHIIEALGLPLKGVYLEYAITNESGDTIEFKVIADSSVEHECLVEMPSSGAVNLRRYRVEFGNKDD